jgi:hypothetical protein
VVGIGEDCDGVPGGRWAAARSGPVGIAALAGSDRGRILSRQQPPRPVIHPGQGFLITIHRAGDPLFYPARPPARWLMCAEVGGRVLMVPLAPARSGDPRRCRPIGCYEASQALAAQYRKDRR